ncbi:hypothetical protein BpHYR1_034464 [Brachionus plicatilis]|uniref:Uncharacterized protein n=1 Tax=Brachionus plicatilis TaxID=10195 RepID=A0A3M7QA08_BRAPC|nr:hypothetical protein BpHYR1_034464 [Brachionus plicatilis]
MMHPETDSSNTTSSENTEPSSEETYEVASRQTHPISPSECNKTGFVQLTVKNNRGENIIRADMRNKSTQSWSW